MTPDELDHFLHQLNEAMTVIRGWTHLAMSSLPPEAPQRAYLEHVQQTVMLTAQRIHDLQYRDSTDADSSEPSCQE